MLKTWAWLPPSPQVLWLSLVLALLSGLALLAFHPRWRGLGKLSFNGQLFLSLHPAFAQMPSAQISEQAFQQAYHSFQQDWPQWELALLFEPGTLRVQISQKHSVWVLRPDVIQRLHNALQQLLDTLPPEKYLVQVHLNGKISGLLQTERFSFAIYEGQLACQQALQKRWSLKERILS